MTGSAVITFDFHNTLVACDDWFNLEVRTLPAAFLNWCDLQYGQNTPDLVKEEATRIYRELRQAIMTEGRELPAGDCVAHVMHELSIPIDTFEIARGVAELMDMTLASARPVSGALQLVHELRETGVKLGIVSSAVYHRFLTDALAQFGMADCFQVVTTSASAGFYKSRPEIYWLTLVALGASAATSVHVGDSLRFDVSGAARAGMKTAWFNHNGAQMLDRAHTPDVIIHDLAQAASPLLGLLHGTTGKNRLEGTA